MLPDLAGNAWRAGTAIAILQYDVLGDRAYWFSEDDLSQVALRLLSAAGFILRNMRARTALCHWVVPDMPVSVAMPVRLGRDQVVPLDTIAIRVSRPMNCCT
jgi:hypothetical protein